jgi:putative hydrolase of the HAD superfamily
MESSCFDAVTFDIGGTLLYSDPSPAEIYAAHLSRLGREVRPEEVGPVFADAWARMQQRTQPGCDRYNSVAGGERAWWGKFVREVLGRLEHEAPWEALLDNLYAAFSDQGIWKTYPHTIETLDRLAEDGIRLAVISNWDGRLPEILTGLDLTDRFEIVTVSSLVGVEKPAPEIFDLTLAKLGVAANRTLHVGDSPLEDYAGSENAGLQAVLIDRHGIFAQEPYRRIECVREVLEMVG